MSPTRRRLFVADILSPTFCHRLVVARKKVQIKIPNNTMYSATDFAKDISILLLFLIMNVITLHIGFIFQSKQECTARPFILLCMQQRTRPVIPKEIFLLCMDFLHFNQVAKFRTVSKFTSSIVSTNIWDIAAALQERRESKGKRVVLFTQYMMSREEAAALPLSPLYK